jgi:hypothetical protein
VSSADAPAPSSDVDVQSIEHLDFRPPCVIRASTTAPSCGKDASFSIRCRTCSYVWLVCAEHMAFYRRVDKETPKVGCRRCMTYVPTLDELAEITPLRTSL